MADLNTVRHAFDRDQRRNVTWPGAVRMEAEHTVRHIDEQGERSAISWFDLREADVEAAINAEIAYFSQLGHTFEWKVYSHDQPPDMISRLHAHNFQVEDTEAVMVLPISSAPERLRQVVQPSILQITEIARVQDIALIMQAVWNEDYTEFAARLGDLMRTSPEGISVYIAYADDVPVSCAWIMFPEGEFASLWGGSTLAEFRGRGLYTELLAARLQEADARGYRYLTLDASPMSEPIVAKHGFLKIADATGCVWTPAASQPAEA